MSDVSPPAAPAASAAEAAAGEALAAVRAAAPQGVARVRVWDLPMRMFHWLLVVCVVASVYTGNVGGVREMDLHMVTGYLILTLVFFRLAWGIVGSEHSRFVSFLRGPRAVLAYATALVKGGHQPAIGHNPMGGWSVVALLASLLVQATTGLFADDEILTEGPLADTVSKATSRMLTAVHEVNANVLYVLISLHLAAVAYYVLIRRDTLIRPMITGSKMLPMPVAERPFASPLLALTILAVAAAGVWWLVDR